MNHPSSESTQETSAGTSSRSLRYVSILAGGMSFLLGGAVIAGWYTHDVSLIQVHPSFVPMQFNTALGFLLCGMAMVAVSLERGGLAAVLAGTAGLVGGLTLIEYIIETNLGIDQLFMSHYITVQTSHPGRMAPNTALCFLLTAVYMLLIRIRLQKGPAKTSRISLVSGITAALVPALGAAALGGYLSGLHAAYGWGNLTRMAIHTSAGFCVLGAAFWPIPGGSISTTGSLCGFRRCRAFFSSPLPY